MSDATASIPQAVLGTPCTLTAVASVPVAGELTSALFACPEMRTWMADPQAMPIKKGDSGARKPLARSVHLAMFGMRNPTGDLYDVTQDSPSSFNDEVKDAVLQFQQDYQSYDLSFIGQQQVSLPKTGTVDKVTALLMDHLLAHNQPPCVSGYKPVTVTASEVPDQGPGELARRCIEVLRWWQSQGIPYSTGDTANTNPYVHPIGFGPGAWFRGSGTATCSPSTMAALFWACAGVLNGKHFAHESVFLTVYKNFIPMQHRQDYPPAAAGAVTDALKIGMPIELTPQEEQSAGSNALKKLQMKVNKLRHGDLVQGWTNLYTPPTTPPAVGWQKKMDAGHCFYITAVDAADGDGNVPGYSYITANLAGVGEQHANYDQWKDIRIARFFKIEGE